MGQEAETKVRRKVFAGYQINEELMAADKEKCYHHALFAGASR
jgi:ornithine carbamoyltransferase